MSRRPKHSHHFSTGYFSKKELKHSDLYHAMLTATPQQRSYMKEHVRQSLGHKPSRHWGHKQIPDELVVRAPRHALEKLKSIEDLPPHAYAESASDKDAGGAFAAISETVGKNLKTAFNYGVDAAGRVAGFAHTPRPLFAMVH